MKRFLALFFILVFMCGATARAETIEAPQGLFAESAVLMDAKSGRVLFEKNGYEQKAMASTTKIMTCILTLEEGEIGKVITASANAASQPEVHLGMRENEQFYLKDLLYSLMLESHNDSAVAIAEGVSGSVEGFAKRMNQKAKEIGCTNTYFITPNGLDETDENGMHSTTAEDLAKIMSYCVCESEKREEFLQVTGTREYSFSNVDGSRRFQCQNRNSFLSMMDGAISGKTGYTGKAGYCYVGALERDGRVFVVALLACGWPNHKNYKWQDTRKLMEYAIENYQYREIGSDITLPRLPVDGGIPDDQSIYEDATVEITIEIQDSEQEQLLLRTDEEVEIVTDYEKNLTAPLEKGTKIGVAIYYSGDEKLAERPIVLCENVEKKTLRWYWSAILKLYLL